MAIAMTAPSVRAAPNEESLEAVAAPSVGSTIFDRKRAITGAPAASTKVGKIPAKTPNKSAAKAKTKPPAARKPVAPKKADATKPTRTATVPKTVANQSKSSAGRVRRTSAEVPISESPFMAPPEEGAYPEQPFEFAGPEDIPEPAPSHPLFHKLHRVCDSLKAPVKGNSWLSRPYSIGFIVGGLWGDELMSGQINSNSGILGMGTFGWDATDHAGFEARIGGCSIETFNEHPPVNKRNTDFRQFDFSWLWYIWGDSRVRPYTRLGVGLENFTFLTPSGERINNIIPAVPIGIGAKFLFNRNVAFRLEFTDNIGFGDGLELETMNTTALTFGAEIRFGGYHKMYWPWDPGRHPW